MESSAKKPVIAVFTFFLLLLLAWLTYSAVGVTKAILTKSWPATTGTVISSVVHRETSSKGKPKFNPVINYSYKIGTEEYFSDKYSSTLPRGSSEWAKQIISRYPDNEVIKVYYNPANPKESVLAPGLQSDNYWMSILSSFFFAMVLLAFIKQIKTMKISS
jgi:hypothetical protein